MVNLRIDLPEGFLDEEVRNGYTVTSKAKRAWAVQIDLLIKLDEVCKKYGLRYFADSGTLLGSTNGQGRVSDTCPRRRTVPTIRESFWIFFRWMSCRTMIWSSRSTSPRLRHSGEPSSTAGIPRTRLIN